MKIPLRVGLDDKYSTSSVFDEISAFYRNLRRRLNLHEYEPQLVRTKIAHPAQNHYYSAATLAEDTHHVVVPLELALLVGRCRRLGE